MTFLSEKLEEFMEEDYWKIMKYVINAAHLALFLAAFIYTTYKVKNLEDSLAEFKGILICLIVSYLVEILRIIVAFVLDSKDTSNTELKGEILLPLLMMIYPFAIFIWAQTVFYGDSKSSEFKFSFIATIIWYYELLTAMLLTLFITLGKYLRGDSNSN